MGGNVQEITYNPKEPNYVRRLGGCYFDGESFSRLSYIHEGVYGQVEYVSKRPSPLDGFRIAKDAR